MHVKAVVFDWAGTLIDFGSRAPMGVFVEAFARFGVDVTIEEAREPMGAAKRDHIAAMVQMPRIREAWATANGAAPGEADIDAIYDVFLPLNEAVAADYAELIPGAKETVDALRARGIKVGSTTGYTRSIMDRVLPVAREQGLVLDCLVCADELPQGRPAPFGIWKNLIALGVHPASAVLKVDDTPIGIAEGVAAGCTAVGVTLSGNIVGLDRAAISDPSQTETIERRHREAEEALTAAGARYVIDTVADLPGVLTS